MTTPSAVPIVDVPEETSTDPIKTCVVIVNYRGASDTEFCLRSLAASARPVRVVVIDTTPNDPELDAVLASFPMVHLIRASENLGFGRGNNVGIRWALGQTACEYIFLLNNDAAVLPDSIALLETRMIDHPEIGIMTPRIAFRDDPTRLWYGGGDVDWRRASVFTSGFNGPVNSPEALREREVSFASGCALFIRRPVLRSVGGFDPRMFMYEEDVDWCLRAQKLGFRILYVPQSLVLHRAQGGSNSPDEKDRADFWSPRNPKVAFYAFHVIRNRLLNVYTHANRRQKAMVALFFPLYLLRRGVPFLLGGRPDAVVAMARGVWDSWKHRKPVTGERLQA